MHCGPFGTGGSSHKPGLLLIVGLLFPERREEKNQWKKKKDFPVFLNVSGACLIVIGGGHVFVLSLNAEPLGRPSPRLSAVLNGCQAQTGRWTGGRSSRRSVSVVTATSSSHTHTHTLRPSGKKKEGEEKSKFDDERQRQSCSFSTYLNISLFWDLFLYSFSPFFSIFSLFLCLLPYMLFLC